MIRRRLSAATLSLILLATATPALAATPDATAGPNPPQATADADTAAFARMVDRAIGFLQTKGQALDGSYSAQAGPGVTAIVTAALVRHGRTPGDPLVAKSLKYLEGFVRDDGGIYPPDSELSNYETCLAILCLAEANRDGRYDKPIKDAERYIKGIQWDEGESQELSSESYGGAGYGSHKRPDMSNTSFLLDALQAAGAGPDDEAVKKALIFVSRCQNLETEYNTTKFSALNPDGGFYYTCAAGGTSHAGTTENGGLRSYASMTYAGLKSMIYAGLRPEDPRVKAALKWIQKNYSLKENPGIADAGLYYYYHTFAKALDAAGLDVVEDAKGVKHEWRRDLREELFRRQQPDGSWINQNSRWMESDPNLVTGYALLALSYCRPMAKSD